MDIQTNRLWAGLAAAAGLLTLAITTAFQMLPQVTVAGACWAPNKVLAFELARTPAQMLAVFGTAGDACRLPIVTAMDAVNTLDVWGYIPSYTAFGICAAIYLEGRVRQPLVLGAIGMAVVALAGDYLETITLLQITQAVDGSADLLWRSSLGAWIKFGALAVHAFLLSRICMAADTRRPILAMLLLLPLAGTAFAGVDNSRSYLITGAFALSWTPLLLVALRDAVRRR